MDTHVERLCARLAQVPAAFCAPVEPNQPGSVRVDAVVADLFRDRARYTPTQEQLDVLRLRGRARSKERRASRRHLELVMIACWLLYDEAFDGVSSEQLEQLCRERLLAMAKVVAARACIDDPDRREELVRVCLAQLGRTPAGESAADAADRLASLDSVRRAKLLEQARAREAKRHRDRLEKLRKQEEEARRQAARATFED